MTDYTTPFPTSCIPIGGEFGNWSAQRKSMGLGPHRGVDFSATHVDAENLSRDIPSAGDGTVTKSEFTPILGNVVVVQHSDGMYTGYCHLSSRDVSVGQNVGRRQKLGVMGDTGSAATAIHLHHTLSNSPEGVYDGEVQDPIAYEQARSGGGGSNVSKPGRSLATAVTGIPNNAFYKRLQWYAHLNGYGGPIDGSMGTESWRGVQRGLQRNFGYTGPIDGKPGPNTFAGLQRIGGARVGNGHPSAADYRDIAKWLNKL